MISTSIPANDGLVSGRLLTPHDTEMRSLVVFIHGGGCNSSYFELGQRSPAATALARGHHVLLLDRPGFAGNGIADAGDPLVSSVAPIAGFVARVRDRLSGDCPVAIIGHSIGGALALAIAGSPRDWPLCAIAVSAIGDEPPASILSWTPDRLNPRDRPSADNAAIFLGPEGSYDWRAITRLRKVAEPWIASEAMDMIHRWPRRWPAIAARVDVPVHLRLADGEKIWNTGDFVIARMAALLTGAPLVDAAILPEGGHLYELHRRGPELIESQLDFCEKLSSRPQVKEHG
jgi:pimeloyl-ACP methyl ester carboxylesterase